MISERLIQQLIQSARAEQKQAYAPYSHFTVGAAALGTDGNIYGGCNVENGSYGLSMCAERNALFAAVAAGCRTFQALVVAGDSPGFTMPCGACLQVMAEFSVPTIILTNRANEYKLVSLHELLPHTFSL
jgi:cytidine deaminase